jgi:oligoribonuclease (3'-5' exoribonuclease)
MSHIDQRMMELSERIFETVCRFIEKDEVLWTKVCEISNDRIQEVFKQYPKLEMHYKYGAIDLSDIEDIIGKHHFTTETICMELASEIFSKSDEDSIFRKLRMKYGENGKV